MTCAWFPPSPAADHARELPIGPPYWPARASARVDLGAPGFEFAGHIPETLTSLERRIRMGRLPRRKEPQPAGLPESRGLRLPQLRCRACDSAGEPYNSRSSRRLRAPLWRELEWPAGAAPPEPERGRQARFLPPAPTPPAGPFRPPALKSSGACISAFAAEVFPAGKPRQPPLPHPPVCKRPLGA